MFRKLFPLTIVSLWGVMILSLPPAVNAMTPLQRAKIQRLRNWVQLMPQNQQKRQARRWDAMVPGDGLATGRASLAELRFNEGSVARLGEQTLFKFVPKTRNFQLNNGTMLLLIPPGRGRTRVKTPNAAAAIRGSALFVRYDREKDTTIVGALTNSGIEVANKDASQAWVLKAGQMMVLVKGQIQGLYNFDLRTFYDTSDLVRGLDLTRKNNLPASDPAIASVQEETVEAISKQTPITGENLVKNPSFVKLTDTPPSRLGEEIVRDDTVNLFIESGQILLNSDRKEIPPVIDNEINVPSSPGNPPVIDKQPPITPTTPPITPTTPPVTPTPSPVTPTKPPVNPTPPPVTPTTPPVTPTTPPVTPTTPPVTPTPSPVTPSPEPPAKIPS